MDSRFCQDRRKNSGPTGRFRLVFRGSDADAYSFDQLPAFGAEVGGWNDLHAHAQGLTGEGFACPGRRDAVHDLLVFPAGAKNDMVQQNCYHNNILIDG